MEKMLSLLAAFVIMCYMLQAGAVSTYKIKSLCVKNFRSVRL